LLPLALIAAFALACQPAAAPAAAPAGAPAPAPAGAAAPAPAASPAAAAGGEVRIGMVVPLTGNFATLGQQNQWAAQTAVDVINNAYPDIKVPLAADAGLPKLGGAKINLVVRDDQSKGDLARTIAEQLITVDKVAWLDGDTT